MQNGHVRTALTIGIGLLLGGAAAFVTKFSPHTVTFHAAAIPTFDDAQFAKSEDIDSRLILARQLPSADAAMCASLANAMLGKRVRVSDVGDPFADVAPETFHEEPQPISAWKGLFKRWMKVDPLAAWDFAVAHNDEISLREAALEQWALLDTKAALKALGNDITDADKYAILMACLETDPATGLKLAAEWQFDLVKDQEPFSSHAILDSLLYALATKSPSAAMEWCQAHAPDKAATVCLGWIQSNPGDCLNWIQSRPTEQQQILLGELCERKDVCAPVVRCLAALTSVDKLKNQITPALIHIAIRDESIAQVLIDELLSNPTDRMLARAEICQQLNLIDPRKAMAFILPSLRTAMPLFKDPDPRFVGCGMGFPLTPARSAEPSISAIADVFNNYIALGPAAGVGKNEVLQMLKQFHPQYLPWMLRENMNSLTPLLGSPASWLEPFVAQASREELSDILSECNYNTREALQDVKSLAPGLLRDVIIERTVEILLENDTPVPEVMNQLKSFGEHHTDLGVMYFYWMDSDPAAAMKHFADDSVHTNDEWVSMIRKSKEQHFEQIQTMAEKLPPGELRNNVAKFLGAQALEINHDYVTSLYWATEITAKEQRTEQIRNLLDNLQTNRTASQNKELIEGIRSIIENSALSTSEKSRWLERIEMEVSP